MWGSRVGACVRDTRKGGGRTVRDVGKGEGVMREVGKWVCEKCGKVGEVGL